MYRSHSILFWHIVVMIDVATAPICSSRMGAQNRGFPPTTSVFLKNNPVSSIFLAPASSSDSPALGSGALRSLFSLCKFRASAWLPLDPNLSTLRTRVAREIRVCPASSLINPYCLASSSRFLECLHSKTLFPCFTSPVSKLFHYLRYAARRYWTLAISHFPSSNERMLAPNSATQGCDKVARSGRLFEPSETGWMQDATKPSCKLI